MTKRDPRKDPKRSDCIRMAGSWIRWVLEVKDGKVKFDATFGNVCLAPMIDTIDEWREVVKNAEVLHAAD